MVEKPRSIQELPTKHREDTEANLPEGRPDLGELLVRIRELHARIVARRGLIDVAEIESALDEVHGHR